MSPVVALDARMLSAQLHGLGRYVHALASSMAALEPDWTFVLLGRSPLADALAAERANVRVVDVRARPFSWREHGEIPGLLKGVDLFHATSVALPLRRPVPWCITVPDLIPLVYGSERLRNRLYFREYLPRALRAARGVLVFSEAVREDLRERLEVPSERVTVAPLGVDAGFSARADAGEAERLAARYGVRRPYLLTTGNPKPHKNLRLALEVFAAASLPGRSLVLHSRSSPELESMVAGAADVVRVREVAEEDLPALYRQAIALFYPSLYEGFGLPVLEAMACGTPVVSSSATSLPEVVGDAGLLVDPRDAAGCVAAVERVCGDEAMREDLSRRGIERAARFTWEACARRTLEVYRAALGRPGS